MFSLLSVVLIEFRYSIMEYPVLFSGLSVDAESILSRKYPAGTTTRYKILYLQHYLAFRVPRRSRNSSVCGPTTAHHPVSRPPARAGLWCWPLRDERGRQREGFLESLKRRMSLDSDSFSEQKGWLHRGVLRLLTATQMYSLKQLLLTTALLSLTVHGFTEAECPGACVHNAFQSIPPP